MKEDKAQKRGIRPILKKYEKEKVLVLESISELIAFQDKKQNILWLNKAAADSVEKTPEELIGEKCYSVWHKSNKICVSCPIDVLLKTGKITSSEITTPSGRTFFIKGFPVRGNEGEIIGAVEVARDITKLKQTEKNLIESEEKYRNLFESSPYSIGIFDLEGTLIDCNKATDKFLSTHNLANDIIGKHFREFWGYHENNKPLIPLFESILNKLKKDGETLEFDFPIYRTAGGVLWAHATVSLIKLGSEERIRFISQDITERKLAEQELESSEIKYREAYNRINFYKDIFSHDINNIFQNIHSSVELIDLNVEQSINMEKDDELLDIIRKQIKRGTNLISNVRILSEIENKDLVLRKREITEVLKDVIDALIKVYKNREINIQIHNDPKEVYIKGNELLPDIFENILINAVRHNQSSLVEILIKFSRVVKDGVNFIKLEFIDNGIGIFPEMKEKIFQRGQVEKKDKIGLGLGLTLVKKIVGYYNGQIWVEDKVAGDHSKGSNFIIILPEEV
ncbi:MAG: PAS domain-containing sensor histidine kinase [Candidatus Lokiarchaeota archaeon]|nr:PAS domain-containing sensor histidine kinase [Candidatus Lokiarchaeota archaeon]